MIQSLEIKNYRNLEHLRIESLSGVNLITGKNNTGKSTLLEAVALYFTKFDIFTLVDILTERGDYSNYQSNNSKQQLLDFNSRVLTSCFTDRNSLGKQISIGQIADSVNMKFVKYIEEVVNLDDAFTFVERKIINDQYSKKAKYFKHGVEFSSGKSSIIHSLEMDSLQYMSNNRVFEKNENIQYVKTNGIDREINPKLWDNISLSPKEETVISALKLIEPSLVGLSFVDEGQKNRIAKVKLSDTNSIVPLKSMGDGINRILTIILAMVNAENGVLLIDEFENGLHYSVQEKLWEIIFNLSDKLNVQVFATTHSNDTINSFESVLNSLNTNSGQVIRLDNVKGKIRQVQFSGQELNIAQSNGIEIR